MSSTSVLASTVDADNPWLGLASFTEETRSFFHGREDDTAELARRVQRKLLTVLFGQSGHGKTSLLRAGLVPRLRPDGYCPVYVRLDYSAGAPTPAEQIKEAIFRATKTAGHWTKIGASVAGESLWEFLHHRDDVLKDEAGRPLIPLLIFDQFEEIFTLAQTDDAGRQRAQTFLADLADLVENRPPADLEARIDRDETDAATFDFARADYRILIALREDYLAHLESLKSEMPSVTQNRVRLARFSGAQAIEAVRGPAPQLVSEEVAGQVVRFVSGGTDLSRAEVEPSLLSLVCRELNNARLARHQPTITADLLEGSRETILQEFYERALADQPSAVRSFIEDELLTDSGFRESVAEERVKKAFAAAGAPADALAELVGRRLLRVEERLDVRRVELTHDVLSGVVLASRSVRREREAKEAAEAQLRATQEKEAGAQRALWRARRVALVCGVLAIGALASAIFGYFNYRRARSAEREAVAAATQVRQSAQQTEATQELAQEARTEAEKIISYLLDDFYNELEPVGRLDVVGELARRAVEYYRALPVMLRTPTTVRNQALALTRYGSVLSVQGKLDDGGPLIEEAIRLFRRLQDNGDKSQELLIGLSVAYRNQSRLLYGQVRRDASLASAQLGVDVLRTTVRAGGATPALRFEYAEALNRLGFMQLRSGQEEASLGTFGESRENFASVGARDGTNLRATSAYADTAAWVMEGASFLGRSDEAEAVGNESLKLADIALARNPGDRRALRAKALVGRYLSDVYADRLQIDQALKAAQQAAQDYRQLIQLDPTNTISRNNLMVAEGSVINLLVTRGDVAAGLAKGQASLLGTPLESMPTSVLVGVVNGAAAQLAMASQAGDRAKVAEAAALLHNAYNRVARDVGESDSLAQSLAALVTGTEARVASIEGDQPKAAALLRASIRNMEALKGKTTVEMQDAAYTLRGAQGGLTMVEVRQKHWPEAEAAAKAALATWSIGAAKSLSDRESFAHQQTMLAYIVAQQGRRDEAWAIIEPVVTFERELAAKGYEPFQQMDLAWALLVTALAKPAQADAWLTEAAAIVEKVPPEIGALHDTRELAQFIREARASLK